MFGCHTQIDFLQKGKDSHCKPLSLPIVETNIFLRRLLKDILQEKEDLHVIGEAGDGLELIDLLGSSNSPLVLLDISMPKLNGIEAACQLKTNSPQVNVLIPTMHEELEYLREAISVGVAGYILKEDLSTDLFFAIEEIR